MAPDIFSLPAINKINESFIVGVAGLQPPFPPITMNRLHAFCKIIFLLGLLTAWLLPGAPAHAQGSIIVSEDRAEVTLPTEMKFYLTASSDANIQKVTLLYGTNGKNCLVSTVRQELKFIPAGKVELETRWNFYQSSSLPPGVEVWWQWQIEDSDGSTLLTQKETMTIVDTRFPWKQLRQGRITLEWAEGDTVFGHSMLALASASLQRLTNEVGITPTGDVHLILYPDARALRGAILNLPSWTGGVAFSDYGVVMIGIAPGEDSWARSVIPHELAHLVTGELTFNCVGGYVPTWLTEGLSVYAEGEPQEADVTRLEVALKDGSLTPLNQLAAGFAAGAARADMAYIQSGQVVAYMIEEYGPEKNRELLQAIQTGSNIDEALMHVYGFNTTGLDNAWRKSLGYGPVPTRPPTQAAMKKTAIPTLALWTAVVNAPTSTLTPVSSATIITASPSQAVQKTPGASALPSPVPTAIPASIPSVYGLPVLVILAAVVVTGLAGWYRYKRSRR